MGLGGTGSVVAALLGRLGLRWFVLMDGDHLEASNFSRVLESVPADIERRTLKAKIAERALRTVVPDADILAVERHLVTNDLEVLSSCDFVFRVDRLPPLVDQSLALATEAMRGVKSPAPPPPRTTTL